MMVKKVKINNEEDKCFNKNEIMTRKYYKANGESNKQILELLMNEVRDNRLETSKIKDILIEGSGKINANRSQIDEMSKSVDNLHDDFRSERNKAFVGSGILTIIITTLRELFLK